MAGKLKPQDLIKIWDASDNSRITAKQWSIRLPVHVAAKIAALSDLYPGKTRTQIIGDLLTTALADVEESFPFFPGKEVGPDPDSDSDELYYSDCGPYSRFIDLANKHLREFESELGNEEPTLFPHRVGHKNDEQH